MNIYFNSHNEFHKTPFGATPTDATINFKITIDGFATVHLRLWQNNEELLYKMSPINDTTYGVTIKTPPTPTLLWYYFIIQTSSGTYYYGNNPETLGGEGQISTTPPEHSYQITVYDKNFAVPHWFRDGIMYQIFVDRFARSNAPNVPLFEGDVSEADRGSCSPDPCRYDDLGAPQNVSSSLRVRPAISGGLTPPLQKFVYPSWHSPLQFHQHPYEDGYAANDFYGGNLEGIIEKLPYLADLNINIIYLNPIFEAYSNHKYDTADYKNIDKGFGDNETFTRLCSEAEKLGIKIILDGVFSHTGADSIYFNKYGTYGENTGAYRDKNSPYRKWFDFDENNGYNSWWGCTTLPNVNELTPSYLDYILHDNDSVVKLWLERGASGWRLDVADELPPEFLKILRKEVKSKDPNAIIIGEVWEDATNKISYSQLREYLQGYELDTVMNYPFKDNVIAFMLGHICAYTLNRRMMSILENYPRDCAYSLMNLVGGHDVVRLKSVLGEMYDDPNVSKHDKQFWKLSPEAEILATKRQKLVALLQMTFVGVPCIYYGDEIGMQGLSDPLNRAPMEWDSPDTELLSWYKQLTDIRRKYDVLRHGEYKTVYAQDGVFAFLRFDENKKLLCIVNRDDFDKEVYINFEEFVQVDITPTKIIINKLINGTKIELNSHFLKLKINALEGEIYEL